MRECYIFHYYNEVPCVCQDFGYFTHEEMLTYYHELKSSYYGVAVYKYLDVE